MLHTRHTSQGSTFVSALCFLARLHLCFCPDDFPPPDLRSCLQVCLQLGTAFDPPGLLTSDLRTSYADADLLKKVTLPVMAIVGDHDRMCPASVSCGIVDCRFLHHARVLAVSRGMYSDETWCTVNVPRFAAASQEP